MNIYIENPTAKHITLVVNAEKFTLSPEELDGLQQAMQSRSLTSEIMSQYKEYYADYNQDKVNKELDSQEASHAYYAERMANFAKTKAGKNRIAKGHSLDMGAVAYRVNADLAEFIMGVSDNNEAEEIVKAAYAAIAPDNTIEYDSESSQFNAYTESRTEALQFDLWLYETYIKPVLDLW